MTHQALLQEWQDVNREQHQAVLTFKERMANGEIVDYAKDEAYMRRAARITELEPLILRAKELDEQAKKLAGNVEMFDNPGRTRGARQPNGADSPEVRNLVMETKRNLRSRGIQIEEVLGRELTAEDALELRDFEQYCSMSAPMRERWQPQALNYRDFGREVNYRADLVSTGTTTGGYMVPTIVSAMILQDLNALEVVRRAGAEVMTVVGNENLPTIADALAARVDNEGSGTIGQTDPTTGVVSIRPSLLAAMTEMSWQWSNRGVGNPMQQIRNSFARGIAKQENVDWWTGAGTAGIAPQGILIGGTSALTAASASVFTVAELDQLWDSLATDYQNDPTCGWAMKAATLTLIRGFVDANDNRIVQPDMTKGVSTLQGKPIYVDSNMPALGASNKPIVLGAFSQYVIAEEQALTFIVDPYSKALEGKNRLIAFKFNDGKVKRAAAFKYMTMAAS